METTILKNGAEEAVSLVTVCMMSLEDLIKENPIALYELVMKCRDRNHVFGNAGELLEQRKLVQSDGQPHDSIRNVVLSAIEGDELDMRLTSPIAP